MWCLKGCQFCNKTMRTAAVQDIHGKCHWWLNRNCIQSIEQSTRILVLFRRVAGIFQTFFIHDNLAFSPMVTRHFGINLTFRTHIILTHHFGDYCEFEKILVQIQWGYWIFTIGYWHMALIFSVLHLWKPKLSWTCTYPWVIIWYQESWPQPQHGLTGGHFHQKSGLSKMGLYPRPMRIWIPFDVRLNPWY